MGIEARSRPIRERLDRCREAHDREGALAACDELLALGPSMARFSGDEFEILPVGMKEGRGAGAAARGRRGVRLREAGVPAVARALRAPRAGLLKRSPLSAGA
jgi:hypothetical protein